MTWNFCDRKCGYMRTYLRILEGTLQEIEIILKLSDNRPICKQLSPFEDSCFSSPWAWVVQKVKA